MQKILYLLLLISVAGFSSQAQSVGIGTTSPNRTAQLDVQSNNKGFLPPRMTLAQRNAIGNPAAGLMLYCTDCGTNGSGEMNYYNGTVWVSMNMGSSSDNITSLPRTTTGTQVITSKNLDVITYRNGDPIPNVTDFAQWDNLTTGAWCWYNNDSTNYAKYGRLYNAYAVNDPRGLAPVGWRVMNNGDWNQLLKNLDPGSDTTLSTQSFNAGLEIKDTTGWIPVPATNCPDCINGNNSSGFSALPGGFRFLNQFQAAGPGGAGGWWSQNAVDENTQSARVVYSGTNNIDKYNFIKKSGLNVRLVREQPATPPYRSIVNTGSVNNISTSSASVQGVISYDGGSFVFNKGFCWSTNPNPTINLPTKSNQGNGNSGFSYDITGLNACTIYHVRAFATNSIGTAYGENVKFNTENDPATNINVNQLLGDFTDSKMYLDGNYYNGPYTTKVTSVNVTSATTATIVVEKIWDPSWAPITFKLDWTNPNNRIVTADFQTNIAPASTITTDPAYNGWQVIVESGSMPGTFSACGQTLQLNIRIGIMDPNTGSGGWFGDSFVLKMAR